MNANEKISKSYWVAKCNVSRLIHELEKLSRRAERKGLIRFDYVLTVNERTEKDINELTGVVTQVRTYQELVVTGEAPKYDGWSLGAVLEHTPEGNIIRKTPDCKVNLLDYRDSKPRCDHCNTNRNRKDTYLVVHERGAVRQIGHDCIRDFLGHQSPHNLAALAEHWFSVSELCDLSHEYDGFGNGSRDNHIFNETLLAFAALAIRRFGYVSKRYQDEHPDAHCSTTRNTVMSWMFPSREDLDRARRNGEIWPHPEAEDFAFAKAAREYVIETLSQKAEQSEFDSNLLIAAKLEAVEGRTAGIACYIPEFYRRSIEKAKELEAKKAQANNVHFGEVKTRYRDMVLTYTGSVSWESQFGYCYRHKFFTQDGIQLSWKTSSPLEYAAGVQVKATFTVKAHGEYKGWKQTDITRAAMEKV